MKNAPTLALWIGLSTVAVAMDEVEKPTAKPPATAETTPSTDDPSVAPQAPMFFARMLVTGAPDKLVEVPGSAGLALLTGAATRLAAGAAMLLVLNYMLTKGAWFWTPSSNDAAFFFIGLKLILGAAGRVGGLDQVLHERYPRVPLW